MPDTRKPFGLSCALTTPFAADGGVDLTRLVAHARSRLAAGCDSVTVFGTTGEGPSLSYAQRAATLTALRAGGLDMPRAVVAGVMATSVDDAIAQVAAAREADVRRFLLAPPYYFKAPRAAGLAAWFEAVLDAHRGGGVDFLLYHIPSVTAVPLPVELVLALAQKHGPLVAGVKDSSGDWSYSSRLLEHARQLVVLIGDERHLAQAVRKGGEGAISGCANFMAERLRALIASGREDPAVGPVVEALLRHPVTPAVKAVQAGYARDDAWLRVAPPLEALSVAAARALQLECSLALEAAPVNA
jgi:4-hydroxy-tetrahydrodipicolinate synthase